MSGLKPGPTSEAKATTEADSSSSLLNDNPKNRQRQEQVKVEGGFICFLECRAVLKRGRGWVGPAAPFGFSEQEAGAELDLAGRAGVAGDAEGGVVGVCVDGGEAVTVEGVEELAIEDTVQVFGELGVFGDGEALR